MSLTPLWITGWECGLATPVVLGTGLADTIAGTVSIQATTKRTGGYALRCTSTGSSSYLQKTLASSDYHVGSVYIYFKDALPNADNIIIRGVNADGDMAIYYESSDSKLYAGKVGVGLCATGYTVTYNTWYRIDYRFYAAATTHTADWQVNGVAQESYSVGSRSSNQMTAIRLGNSGVTADTYFDDLALCSASGDYPVGAHGVSGLRPNADGTHNNAANVMESADGTDIDASGNPAYQFMDDNPWTSTHTEFVKQSTIGAENYAEVQFEDTLFSTILGVQAVVGHHSSGTAANDAETRIRDSDSQETVIFNGDVSETTLLYKTGVVSTPSGGWTQAHVNALRARIGYSGDVTDVPYWDYLLLEVARSGSESFDTVLQITGEPKIG
ncbi:MAG: hypothetical protein E4H44_01345 [Candidatus Aminicenantes bacterium]|nr:MAG: hypothetical protein E4H44_01345 [Candidatus Aminicenantes bacterium]